MNCLKLFKIKTETIEGPLFENVQVDVVDKGDWNERAGGGEWGVSGAVVPAPTTEQERREFLSKVKLRSCI